MVSSPIHLRVWFNSQNFWQLLRPFSLNSEFIVIIWFVNYDGQVVMILRDYCHGFFNRINRYHHMNWFRSIMFWISLWIISSFSLSLGSLLSFLQWRILLILMNLCYLELLLLGLLFTIFFRFCYNTRIIDSNSY
jgi:hypothetical protein